MFGKTKNYILNTANIAEPDYEIVGREAIAAATLTRTGIVVANSLVLTTEAFEDFITAANLTEKITAALTNVRADDSASANEASQDISAMIMQASFPSLILNPLIQSYKSLCGFSDKYVTVQPSWTQAGALIPQNDDDCLKLDVKGEPALLYAIKQAWACLFSPAALLERANADYHGNLTVAVLIRKMSQAEISGKAFSIDPITHEKAITIEALLGLENSDTDTNITPDIYRIDPDDMRIREKVIMSQEYMFLRKGRAKPEEEPNMRVPISPEWRKRQKLADHLIVELAKVTAKLAAHYGYPLEVKWAFETGKLIVLEVTELKHASHHEVDLQSEIDKALQIQPEPTHLEVLPMAPMLPPAGKFAMKQFERPVNIKSLAEEVQNLVESNEHEKELVSELAAEAEPVTAEDIPMIIDQVEPEQIDAAPKEMKSDLGILTNIYLDISDMSTDKLANASMFDGVYMDGTQTVLRHKFLAEEIAKDKQKLSHLIESYALEIATAAKVIEPKPIYYSFSDIGANERAKLDVKGLEDELNGSERFLSKPEAMIAEILAIKRARSTYDAKNIKLILPRLRSETELSDVKKILSSQNVRRSSVLQLFAEVALPSFVYELIDVHASELDGIIINMAKLAKASTGRTHLMPRDYLPVIHSIKFMLDQNAGKKFHSLIRISADKDLITDIMSLNVGGFIFTEVPENSVFDLIKAMESNQLHPAPVRRGRRPKSL